MLVSGEPQGALIHSPTFENTRMVSQPKIRPISQEQLVAEVKGIYVSLTMVEGKCIQYLKQLEKEAPPRTQPKLNNEQYQTLIALHRTLLHLHYDFFLASQHPSATPAVKSLPRKYAMPARLWRHAIHSFLELLRNMLPASLDYMLAFIYLAYSMMTLFLETVTAFENTWIECLGDLGRYRMAIEDNVREREVWAQVARQWYLKSANRSPETGRLYHHLAILARPDALRQLLYYGKSLAVPTPFTAARESIMVALFEPTLNLVRSEHCFSVVVSAIVRSHATIFTGKSLDTFNETLSEIKSNLNGHIACITNKYLEQGYYIAISNCIALLGYGADDNPLVLLLKPQLSDSDADTIMLDSNADTIVLDADATTASPALSPTFNAALRLFIQTTKIHLLRIGDINTLSFLHVTLVFIRHIARHPSASASALIFPHFPWTRLVRALNAITILYPPTPSVIESPTLPAPDSPTFRPFPEDFAMQGLGFTASYFPDDWFSNENVEPLDYLEADSMRLQHRPQRIPWLGVQIATWAGAWMGYAGVGGGNDGYIFFVGEKGRGCFEEDGESGDRSGSDYGENGVSDGSEYGEDGDSDGNEYGEDGTEYGEDGTEYGEDGAEYGEDGAEYGEDGTEYGEDGESDGTLMIEVDDVAARKEKEAEGSGVAVWRWGRWRWRWQAFCRRRHRDGPGPH
jgi:hypothetical protein